MPPSSTERIFSSGRRTIAWDRMSLGSINIERTECLKSWLRSNITSGRLVTTDVVAEARDRAALIEH